MQLCNKEGFVNVVENDGYIQLNWVSFFISLFDLQDVHRQISDFVRERQASNQSIKTLIAETSKTKGFFETECTDWFKQEQSIDYFNVGIERILTIVPSHPLPRVATRERQGQNKEVLYREVEPFQ